MTTMSKVEIYSKNHCPYCQRAKHLLATKGIDFEEIEVTFDADRQQEMIERSGRRTVPQVFIGNVHIGGSDDLAEAHRNGLLDRLIGAMGRAA
jgi:glutaredoxin 3